jgi:hypothetical protein
MTSLEPLRLVLLIGHLLGLAAIIGPYLLQARHRSGFELRVMLVGAAAQLVTGVGLVWVRASTEENITPGMTAVKLTLTLLVIAALFVALMLQLSARHGGRPDAAVRPWMHAAGLGAILNVLIAVLWA